MSSGPKSGCGHLEDRSVWAGLGDFRLTTSSLWLRWSDTARARPDTFGGKCDLWQLPRFVTLETEHDVEQWHRLALGHGAAEYQTLREVRRLRLHFEQAMGPASVFPVLLDRASVSLWLYLPPGNDGLAEHLKALPCPAPDDEQDRLVKLSEEYHPACLPLRVPVPADSVGK